MTTSFPDYVTTHFPALAPGVHEAASGEACALEAYHAWRGEPWSDTPDTIWDFRPLNDAPWSSATARTVHLAPVIAAYADCTAWPLARQQAVIQRVVLLTVQRVIAALPGLPDPVRHACTACGTLTEAEASAKAAWAAAGAAEAARAAARAARVAAWAAVWAAAAEAANSSLIVICELLCQAVEEPAL